VEKYEYLRVEDPAGGVAVGLVGLVGSLVPCVLDLGEKAVLVLLGALLDLLASGGQVAGELAGSPAVVGLGDIVVPVLLDEVGKILAVGRSGVWDIVVGKPALKLSLVPLVVSCAASPSVRTCLTRGGAFVDTARSGRGYCKEQAHAMFGHAMNELTGFASEPVCGGSLGRQSDGSQGGQGESHDERVQCLWDWAMLVMMVVRVVLHRMRGLD
jgi:hypothetical protein